MTRARAAALSATSIPDVLLVADVITAFKQNENGEEGELRHQPPRRDFRSGLFDCHESWAVCLDACLCTYCVASAHHNFLMNDTAGVYFPACCGLLCVDAGLSALSSCLPSSLYLHTYLMRSAIRQRYGLHSADGRVDSDEHDSGSYRVCSTESLLDLLAVSLCLTCVIAQHQREIMHQGDWWGSGVGLIGVVSCPCLPPPPLLWERKEGCRWGVYGDTPIHQLCSAPTPL
ncbi:hypothetical protein LPMP_010700 [Leishmania panamensis]|uniref:Ama1 protein, putative n=1 Tax=Leishmania panamensis TaxID=5679 RepID=A0A088RHE9_LEIPA|nr:hypothetical protein LPMP_010700 [Leishmania panamensis]AIN95170.1 hypothetical protein LPMP_010700 [Leishmania panamensis]